MNQSEVDLAWIAYNAYKEAYKREHGLANVYPEFPYLALSTQRIWSCVAVTIKAAVSMGIANRTTSNDYGDV